MYMEMTAGKGKVKVVIGIDKINRDSRTQWIVNGNNKNKGG